MARASVSLIVAALLGALIAGPPTVLASSLQVQVAQGTLEGVAAGASEEFRGIPYAAPPVGPLRWRPPQAPASWSGVRDASRFGSACPQLLWPDGTTGSEDCLYLNVFRSAGAHPGDALPVMVHLHPGGNFVGGAYQEASALTSRGVVVVTLNYRLGALGFLGHPALTAEGSLPEQGLLDQIAALRWVRTNIAAFGGDPANVTLFGMSAGSFDAAALVASPLASGLFARAAIEGDSFWSATGTFNALADKESVGIEVASAVGCSGAADVSACLRATPVADLVLATGQYDTGPLVGGSVLPVSALAAYTDHGAGVPLLIGSNREEAVWLTGDPAMVPSMSANGGPNNVWHYGDFLRNVTDLVGTRNQAPALKLYPTKDYDSSAWTFVTMGTDAIYGCPTRRLALAASGHGPVFRYLFTHVMANDPDQAALRAFHSLEDTFLWHHFYALASGDPYPASAGEETLAATMAAYWTNFAKGGDPNGPGLPAWPAYRAASERIAVLDDPVGTGTSYHVAQCGLMDTLATPFPACGSLCRFFAGSAYWHRFKE